MRAFVFCLFLALFGFTSSTIAAGVKAGYPACADMDSMNEFTQAAVRGDQKAIGYLIGKTCIYTDYIQKNDITVLKSHTFKGLSEIRVYMEDGTLRPVVPSEAIKR